MISEPDENTADAPGRDAGDALRWWEARGLAEDGQAQQFAERAAAGDGDARRELADWLAERGHTERAIEVIRPLADSGDDVAQMWLARWLAGCGRATELRERAQAGSDHALTELAGWLAGHGGLAELRELVTDHTEVLGRWLAGQHDMTLVRLAAELGDDQARRRLDGWLRRLGERAEAGSDQARRELARWAGYGPAHPAGPPAVPA